MLEEHEPFKSEENLQHNGEDEDSSDHDLAAFYYPALQAADIFELEVDIAFGGMDQRKAHMYMREVAEKNQWTKPTCIHTPCSLA